MRADERVLVLGEDVAEGGPWGATAGLVGGVRRRARQQHADQRGGDLRDRDRRRAVGASARGRDHVHRLPHARPRPARQPGGEGALHVRRPAARCRSSLRTQGGAGQRGGAQHSQSLEAWLTARARAEGGDAEHRGRCRRPPRGRDRRPESRSCCVENKTLYFRRERGRTRRPVPLGRGAIVRRGQRRHRRRALAARPRGARRRRGARCRRDRGRGDRPANARAARPRDDRRVGRPDAPARRRARGGAHGGFGAELAAQVQEAAFDELDAPIERVGAPFAPIPFSPPLEDAYLPGRAEVVAAVRRALAR